MGRPERQSPKEHAPPGTDTWVDQPIAYFPAEVARRLALALDNAIGDRSIRSVAEETGVARIAIHAVLNGDAYPDIHTVAQLQSGLNVDLLGAMSRADPATNRGRLRDRGSG